MASDYIGLPLGAGHRTALPGRNSRGQLRPAQGHATDDDEEDRRGYERWRAIFARSILALHLHAYRNAQNRTA